MTLKIKNVYVATTYLDLRKRNLLGHEMNLMIISNALHEEEGLVGVGLSFVQGPGWSIERRTHGYVPDDGDSHVRVRFQAERHDGDDDEEDWDDADDLKDSDKM